MPNVYDECLSIRKDIFLSAVAGGVGHLASAFSCVEILHALFLQGVLHHDPKNPLWENRDRFVLSKGHASLAYYVTLSRAGYFDRHELFTFCRPGTQLGGEPSMRDIPYIEASTGSLGHGLPLGVGMALALQADARSEHVYVLLGDGECEEGSIWEAIMSATAYHLDNLTAILDQNHMQKMDRVESIMGIRDWKERFASFGWDTVEIDGHDAAACREALAAPNFSGAPRVVIANTIKGKGVSIMENDPSWHWRMPNKKLTKVFMSELGITQEELEQCRRPM